MGEVAAGLLSDSRDALFHLKLVRVNSAKVKVVKGLLYRLEVVVGSTSCTREEEEEYEEALSRCAESGDDEVWGSSQVCRVDVFIEPTEESTEEPTKEGGEDGEEKGEKKGEKKKGKKVKAILARGSYDESCFFD